MRFPRWLIAQRTGLFLFLSCGVLLLVYALGFVSDIYLFYAYGNKGLVQFYDEMQIINTGLLWKAVLVIVFAVILFLLDLGKHPAGIITLVLVLAVSAASIFFSADTFIALADIRQEYTGLDLSSLDRYIARGAIKYEYSTLTYDLGFGIYALFFLSVLFMLITVMRNAFAVRIDKESK